jgi:hypothetical protein
LASFFELVKSKFHPKKAKKDEKEKTSDPARI